MTNRLHNAGFLDGTAGWSATTGLTAGVDETVRGATGRIVLKATGTSSASGQARYLYPSSAARADISGLDRIEVFAWLAAWLGGAPVPPKASAIFFNSSGAAISTVVLNVRPPLLTLHGVGVMGLRDTFWSVYAILNRPANAVSLSIEPIVTSTASSQSMEVALLKPYIGPINARGRAAFWGPGLHANPDLQRRNWPSDISLHGREGGEPKPWAIAHDAGAGLPVQRRVSAEPVRKLTTQVRIDAVQRAQLEAFAANEKRFWLMEPESEKLCLASFDAEGAPRLVQHHGAMHTMALTLWLETA